MDLDVYHPCPCGSGKKIKFCCISDSLNELSRITRSIEAKQFHAALDQIDRITAVKGVRPAFLIMKAQLLLPSEGADRAAKAVEPLLPEHSKNPNVVLFQCMGAIESGEIEKAHQLFQDANELSAFSITYDLWDFVCSLLVQLLTNLDHHAAARAVAELRARLTSKNDAELEVWFTQIGSKLPTPIIVKFSTQLIKPSADFRHAAQIETALEVASKGCWQRAAEMLEALEVSGAEALNVWQNVARLRTWLLDRKKAVAAWRRFGAHPAISEEMAIESEAVAQYLDDSPPAEIVDEVAVTIAIKEVDRLMERLLSSRKFVRLNVTHDDPEEVPPKAAFLLLSRSIDDVISQPVNPADVPVELATVLVYGRETDRDARLIIEAYRTDEFPSALNTIAAVAGDAIAEMDSRNEEVIDQLSRYTVLSSRRYHLRTTEQRAEVESAIERRRLLEIWPAIRSSSLDGKSPLQVASDPKFRIRLQASVLLLETEVWQSRADFDCNELRRKLGIPEFRKVAFDLPPAESLVAVRLPRIELSILPDEKILSVISLAKLYGIGKTVFEASLELLKRSTSQDENEIESVMMNLVTTAPNPLTSLGYLKQLQKHRTDRGRPNGPLHVYEFELLSALGRRDELIHLGRFIANKYGNDENTMQLFMHVLEQKGMLRHQKNQPEASPQAAPASPIWTPGQPVPAPTQPDALGTQEPPQKSKLWLPGMD